MLDELAGPRLESEIARVAGPRPAALHGAAYRAVAIAEARIDRIVGPHFREGGLAMMRGEGELGFGRCREAGIGARSVGMPAAAEIPSPVPPMVDPP